MELPKMANVECEIIQKYSVSSAILKRLPNLLGALEGDKLTSQYIVALRREMAAREPHSGENWDEQLESDPVTLFGFLMFHAQYRDFQPLISSRENWPKTDAEAEIFSQRAQISLYFSAFSGPVQDQEYIVEPPYSPERLVKLIELFLSYVKLYIASKGLARSIKQKQVNTKKINPDKEMCIMYMRKLWAKNPGLQQGRVIDMLGNAIARGDIPLEKKPKYSPRTLKKWARKADDAPLA